MTHNDTHALEIPPASNDPFPRLLWVAGEEACEHFKAHLIKPALMSGSAAAHRTRKHLRESYEGKTSIFSVKHSINQLLDDQQLYLNAVAKVKNPAELYDLLETIAGAQIDYLVFQSNNMPEAHLRRDQFALFVEAITEEMKRHGYMEAHDTRFDDLIEGYNAAIHGYQLMRDRVEEMSDGQQASLYEYAEANEPDEANVPQGLMSAYDLVTESFGFAVSPHGAVPPAYFYLQDLASRIAVRQAKNDLPGADSLEALQPAIDRHMQAMSREIHTLLHNPQQLASIVPAERYLKKLQREAFQVPEEFEALVLLAHEAAYTRTMAALPRIQKESALYLQGDRTRSRSVEKMIGMQAHPYKHLEKLVKNKLLQWSANDLRSLDSMEDVVEHFDMDADACVAETIAECAHPGIILAGRTYAESFGKELAASMRERGYPVRGIQTDFAALDDKYQMGFSAHWEAARWCRDYSDDAYNTFGDWAMHMQCAKHAKQPDALSNQQVQEAYDEAWEKFSQAAESLGLAREWVHPYLPALYRLAADHATDVVERNEMRVPKTLEEWIAPPIPDDTSPHTLKREDKIKLASRAEEIMDEARDMIASEMQWQRQRFRTARADNGMPAPAVVDPLTEDVFIDAHTLSQLAHHYEHERGVGMVH